YKKKKNFFFPSKKASRRCNQSFFHNSWCSTFHQTEFCGIQSDYENGKHGITYPSLNSKYQDSSRISFLDFTSQSFSDFTSLFSDDNVLTDLPMDDSEFNDVCRWLNDNESVGYGNMNNISSKMKRDGDLWSPDLSGVSCELLPLTNSTTSLILPGNIREMDIQMSLHHLLADYGEAMENGHKELAEVIIRSIKGKINPLGESLEHVASKLFQEIEDQGSYLRQESGKIIDTAFKVFYQVFPLGKFSHFTANSAIIEVVPDDAQTVHIVDFDMGEWIQWPPIIEAIGQRRKALRCTSIKKTEEQSTSDQWRFEETKRRLLDYTNLFGLRLQVEEMTIEELASELRRMKKRGKESEWLVFNCMFKLPHMGKRMCRIDALEFLKLATELLLAKYSTHKGLVTFSDGEATDISHNPNYTYSAFFNKNLMYYQSILESLEFCFPAYLAQTRLAMQSLFLAPQVFSFTWIKIWEEKRSVSYSCQEIGLQVKRVSKENLLQARELVNERGTPFRVSIEEERKHEMVLEWKGTSLVRVSI
ncbi:protein NODULATION SIGNALING PATHWAY 2-like, partial [Capsicum annuum]|uniref:protein NODULATION SIGNALING PATHWAY 2-like n=1 Tax=Capsicum annuum TaxID=4072 RepID=UPI001FB094A1